MPSDPLFYIVGLSAVFLIAFGRGAFGGGLAILGVPLLALVIDPITATVMMAPIVSAMDPFGFWAFPPRTWSRNDLVWLVPGLLCGLLLGAVFFVSVDPRLVALGIAIVTLWFTARWFLRERTAQPVGAPVNPPKALVCGTLAGFTTFIAHGGNAPIAIYLLPRGLSKTVFASTNSALFTLGNSVKLVFYVWLVRQQPEALWLAVLLMPAIPLGVWLGKLFHDRLAEDRLYLFCYLLVAATGLKLLVDSLRALLV
jgi:uncharacterized membrane protein YfcA